MSRQRAGKEIPQRPTAESVPHPVPVAFAKANAILRGGVGEEQPVFRRFQTGDLSRVRRT